MRLRTWLITLPLLALGVWFTLANSVPTRLSFDATSADNPAFSLTAPLFVWLLASLFLGFFIGSAAMWFSAGGVRKKARSRAREVKQLKKQAESMQMSPRPSFSLLRLTGSR
ncbi:MAG: LapA family protein [Pseudomonadota bacterium]